MKKLTTLFLLLLSSLSWSLAWSLAWAHGKDDPVLTMVTIDQLEYRDADGANPLVWNIDAWVGRDLDKFWLKTEGERVSGEVEEAELQLLYSRAVTPNWDFQIGWRRDFKPEPTRDWLALSFHGVAPFFIETDASLFLGEGGQVGARLDAEYEMMFTQKLVLVPELELNLHSKDDEAVGIGSGLSDMELGVRLRYEIRREFAPYIGVVWIKKFGNTADFARAEGEKTDDVQLVAGVRFWF